MLSGLRYCPPLLVWFTIREHGLIVCAVSHIYACDSASVKAEVIKLGLAF